MPFWLFTFSTYFYPVTRETGQVPGHWPSATWPYPGLFAWSCTLFETHICRSDSQSSFRGPSDPHNSVASVLVIKTHPVSQLVPASVPYPVFSQLPVWTWHSHQIRHGQMKYSHQASPRSPALYKLLDHSTLVLLETCFHLQYLQDILWPN